MVFNLLFFWFYKKMEKIAFKTQGPLVETTRHNIRTQLEGDDQEIFFIRKRPLSDSEVKSSPRQGDKTFLLVETMTELEQQEKRLESLQQELRELKEMTNKRITDLEEVLAMANTSLYEPIVGHRMQAVASLMKPTKDLLDRFVRDEINKNVRKIRDKSAKQEFKAKFNGKASYLALMEFHDSTVQRIIKSAEDTLLHTFEQQGICIPKRVDVKGSMRTYKKVKRLRDLGSHIFDYDFEDPDRATSEERKDSLTIQACVLKDIKDAFSKGWLSEFKKAKEESEDLLPLLIESKMRDLQVLSGCIFEQLVEMPYKAGGKIRK